MEKYVSGAKKIIEKNIYLTLATSTKSGRPWISPLFFVYDKHYNLYWVSNKDSLHSKLLRNNPKAAITIFDSRAPEGAGDGVYFEAKVKELVSPKEIKEAMSLFNKRVKKNEFKIKINEDVSGQGIWRISKATPTKIYKLTEGEFVNGQYVDKKIEIDLQA